MNFIRRLNEMKRRRALIIAGFALCILVGFMIGAIAFNGARGSEDDSLGVAKSGEISVLPDTTVTWEVSFLCGHTQTLQGHRDVLGYTRADIGAAYPTADIVQMTAQAVTIRLELDEYCPEHYVLILAEPNVLAVMRTDLDALEARQIAVINVDVAQLEEDLIAELGGGKVFDSLMEIDEFVEGVES